MHACARVCYLVNVLTRRRSFVISRNLCITLSETRRVSPSHKSPTSQPASAGINNIPLRPPDRQVRVDDAVGGGGERRCVAASESERSANSIYSTSHTNTHMAAASMDGTDTITSTRECVSRACTPGPVRRMTGACARLVSRFQKQTQSH